MSGIPNFDAIEITSVGRGDKVIVDTIPNDTETPLLGDWYGILRIHDQPYVLVSFYRKVKGEMLLRWGIVHKDDIGNFPLPQQVIDAEIQQYEES